MFLKFEKNSLPRQDAWRVDCLGEDRERHIVMQLLRSPGVDRCLGEDRVRHKYHDAILLCDALAGLHSHLKGDVVYCQHYAGAGEARRAVQLLQERRHTSALCEEEHMRVISRRRKGRETSAEKSKLDSSNIKHPPCIHRSLNPHGYVPLTCQSCTCSTSGDFPARYRNSMAAREKNMNLAASSGCM